MVLMGGNIYWRMLYTLQASAIKWTRNQYDEMKTPCQQNSLLIAYNKCRVNLSPEGSARVSTSICIHRNSSDRVFMGPGNGHYPPHHSVGGADPHKTARYSHLAITRRVVPATNSSAHETRRSTRPLHNRGRWPKELVILPVSHQQVPHK
ncbi:unnamed protein product [Ectocarpus sp. 12 AP-2014]